MDDTRIKQLTDEVLAQLAGSELPQAADLEARVAALERALRHAATAQAPAVTAALIVARTGDQPHPSLQLLDVAGGTDHCVLEPGRPCSQSGRCRQLGH